MLHMESHSTAMSIILTKMSMKLDQQAEVVVLKGDLEMKGHKKNTII